jgi:hypothetical protein
LQKIGKIGRIWFPQIKFSSDEFGHARKNKPTLVLSYPHFCHGFDDVIHKVSVGALIPPNLGDQIKSEDLKEKRFKNSFFWNSTPFLIKCGTVALGLVSTLTKQMIIFPPK